jgi:hypothetical protein
MAQINLLKQQTSKTTVALPKVFVGLMVVILLGLGGYYFYLNSQIKKIADDTLVVQTKLTKDKQLASSVPNRDEILLRQQQIKILKDLITKHIYWSQIFPSLSKVTYNTASYSSMRIGGNNTLILSGSVPSVEDLDLYLQVFDLPQVYKFFNHVRISAFTKQQDKNNVTSIKFEATLQYDPSIIQYVDPNKPVTK